MRVSPSGSAADAYAAVVAAKLRASVKQAGKDLIKLIEPCATGSCASPPGVGQNLDIKA